MSKPTLLMAGLILLLFVWSGYRPEVAGLFPAPWDKLVHLALFGVLAGVIYHGLGYHFSWLVVLFCVTLGIWDEWRQLMLPGRSASLGDLLFDLLGVASGLLVSSRIALLRSLIDRGRGNT